MPTPAPRGPLDGWTLVWSRGLLAALYDLFGAAVLPLLGGLVVGGLLSPRFDPKPGRMLRQSWAQGDWAGLGLQVATFLVLVLVAGAFGLAMIRIGVGLGLDLLGARVVVAGPAHLRVGRQKGVVHFVDVGERSFEVDAAVHGLVTERARVRLQVGRFQSAVFRVWVET
jgi:hypothetical protein